MPQVLEGFTFVDEPKPEPKAKPTVLEGFTFVDEESAERTWTGHPAPTTVGEGVRQIGRDVMEAGRRVGGALESAGKTSYGLLSGELEPSPENVMPGVMATIMPAQRGTAAAIASVVGRRGAAPAAQTAETALPRYLQSEGQMAVAERLANVPGVGGPIRKAAAKPLAQFETELAAANTRGLEHFSQTEAAALRPTGAVPDQTRAGQILSQGAKAEREFVTPKGTVTGSADQRTSLPVHFEAMIRSESTNRAENNIGRMLAMAGARSPKEIDFKNLAELRKNINSTDWRHVEGAAFVKMGEVPVEGAPGAIRAAMEFDPITALRKYEALPEAGRRILFGSPKAPFRTHLDSLMADNKSLDALVDKLNVRNAQLDPLRRIPQQSTVGGMIEGGLVLSSALVHPLVALTGVVGARVAANMLAKPQTAGALAQWSRAYVRFFQSGGAPGAMAALKIATDNLGKTSGEDIDSDKLMAAVQGGSGVPIREVKVRKNDGIPSGIDPDKLSPYWGQDLGGIEAVTTRAAPRGIPWESMRRSQNVETKGPPPFKPPSTYLDTNEERHDWSVRNIPGYQAQVDRTNLEGARELATAGPLSRAAGLADLEAQSRRPQVPPIESVLSTGRGPFEKAGTNSARKSKATEEAERRRRDAATAAGRK